MTSPVVKDGVIYVSVQSYGDSGRTLRAPCKEWLDTNQDGKLSRDEVPPEFREKFDQSDKNKDGFLTGDEIDTAFQSPANMVGGGNTIQAVQGGGTGRRDQDAFALEPQEQVAVEPDFAVGVRESPPRGQGGWIVELLRHQGWKNIVGAGAYPQLRRLLRVTPSPPPTARSISPGAMDSWSSSKMGRS